MDLKIHKRRRYGSVNSLDYLIRSIENQNLKVVKGLVDKLLILPNIKQQIVRHYGPIIKRRNKSRRAFYLGNDKRIHHVTHRYRTDGNPLHIAVLVGNLSILEYLMKVLDFNENSYHYIILSNNSNEIQQYLKSIDNGNLWKNIVQMSSDASLQNSLSRLQVSNTTTTAAANNNTTYEITREEYITSIINSFRGQKLN